MLNRLDELLPELAKFCRLLEKNVDEEFVMNQLLRLGSIYDYSDEAGRRALSALLRTCSSLAFHLATFAPHLERASPGHMLVQGESESVMESTMKLLRHIHPREEEYVRYELPQLYIAAGGI